jgi:hypothetical protein
MLRFLPSLDSEVDKIDKKNRIHLGKNLAQNSSELNVDPYLRLLNIVDWKLVMIVDL